MPVSGSSTRLLCRLAEAYTPMTEAGSITSVGRVPLRVRSVLGTWIAIVCTFRPWVPLTPTAAADGIRCAAWNGRSAPRSKMLPRSTWKLSARWPAKNFRPPGSRYVAAAVNVAS